jgi:5-methylcytosine-specific restriction endonuclease McrA
MAEANAICTVDGCDRTETNRTHHWCDAHYKRFWATGDVRADVPLLEPRRRPVAVIDYPDGTRQCERCARRLPLEDYHFDKRGPLGRRKSCRTCRTDIEVARHHIDRERIIARQRAFRKANIAMVRAREAEAYEKNRGRAIAAAVANSHIRRARLAGRPFERGVTVPALRKRDGEQCHYCGVALVFGRFAKGQRPDNMGTLEHKIAIARGGAHTWGNCVLACWRCNISKSARDYADMERAEVSSETQLMAPGQDAGAHSPV